MKKKILTALSVITCLVIVILSFASCGSKNAAESARAQYDVFEEEPSYGFASDGNYKSAVSESAYEENGAEPGSPESKPSGGLEIADAANRKIIRNASLDIETKDFDEFIADVEKAVGQSKGYIESSEVYGNSYYSSSFRRAGITARIPAENLDDFINKIGDMGNITSKSVSASDITAKYTDLEARIESYEAERTALLAILEKATKVEEIITLRDKLAEVNANLDSYKRQIKSFDSLVAYSTVELEIEEVDRVSPSNEKKGFFTELGERLSNNLYNIGQGARSFALWFISSLPYLLIIAAVITAAALIIRRQVRKRRAKRAQKNSDQN